MRLSAEACPVSIGSIQEILLDQLASPIQWPNSGTPVGFDILSHKRKTRENLPPYY
jgi:hypothetical protein